MSELRYEQLCSLIGRLGIEYYKEALLEAKLLKSLNTNFHRKRTPETTRAKRLTRLFKILHNKLMTHCENLNNG